MSELYSEQSHLSPSEWLHKRQDDLYGYKLSIELELADAVDHSSPDRFKLLQQFTIIEARLFNCMQLSTTYPDEGIAGIEKLYDFNLAQYHQQQLNNEKLGRYMSTAGILVSRTMLEEVKAKLSDTSEFINLVKNS